MGNHGAAGRRARAGKRAARSPDASRPRPTVLADWPVSYRLFAVIALALVMGVVFGGFQVATAEGNATQYGRVLLLARLGQQVTILIQDLQNERDDVLVQTAAGGPGDLTAL